MRESRYKTVIREWKTVVIDALMAARVEVYKAPPTHIRTTHFVLAAVVVFVVVPNAKIQ